jgi:hypothetical protein
MPRLACSNLATDLEEMDMVSSYGEYQYVQTQSMIGGLRAQSYALALG